MSYILRFIACLILLLILTIIYIEVSVIGVVFSVYYIVFFTIPLAICTVVFLIPLEIFLLKKNLWTVGVIYVPAAAALLPFAFDLVTDYPNFQAMDLYPRCALWGALWWLSGYYLSGSELQQDSDPES